MTEATSAFAFARPLTVCIDFRNPHAYLAVAPTRALEERLGLGADWLPFTAAPLTPPKPARPDDDRGARHRRIRAEYFAADLARYAAARGLSLGNIYRTPDCTSAALGALWTRQHARDHLGRYVEAVFERLWGEDGEIEGLTAITGVLCDLSLPVEGFEAWGRAPGPLLLTELRSGLEAAGIFNVPAYVVDGDIFYGRQHLPMVEWLLTGRSGELPI